MGTTSIDRYIILDGDCRVELPDPAEIPESENDTLKERVKEITNIEVKNLNLSKINDNLTNNAIRSYLKFIHNHLYFLPLETPEQIIWENCTEYELREKYQNVTNYKTKFEALAKDEYGEHEVNSDIIFNEQKRILNKINQESECIKSIKEVLIKILELS